MAGLPPGDPAPLRQQLAAVQQRMADTKMQQATEEAQFRSLLDQHQRRMQALRTQLSQLQQVENQLYAALVCVGDNGFPGGAHGGGGPPLHNPPSQLVFQPPGVYAPPLAQPPPHMRGPHALAGGGAGAPHQAAAPLPLPLPQQGAQQEQQAQQGQQGRPGGSPRLEQALGAQEFVPRAAQLKDQAVQLHHQAVQLHGQAQRGAAQGPPTAANPPPPPPPAAGPKPPRPGFGVQPAAGAAARSCGSPSEGPAPPVGEAQDAAKPREKSPLAICPIPGQPRAPASRAIAAEAAPDKSAGNGAPSGAAAGADWSGELPADEVAEGCEEEAEGSQGGDGLDADVEASALASGRKPGPPPPEARPGQDAPQRAGQPPSVKRPAGWGRGAAAGAVVAATAPGSPQPAPPKALSAAPDELGEPSATAAAAPAAAAAGAYDDLLAGEYAAHLRRQRGASPPPPEWSQPEKLEQDFPSLGAPSAAATNGRPAVGAAWGGRWAGGGGALRLAQQALQAAGRPASPGGGGGAVEEAEVESGLRVAGDATSDLSRRRQVQKQTFEHTEPHLRQRRKINVLEGLELHRGVLTGGEQARVVEAVEGWVEMGKAGRLRGRTFSAPRKWLPGKGRMTMQFGCCYNYATDSEGRPPGILAEEIVEPMPPLLRALCRRLTRWGVLPAAREPDSAIINIYEAGDCIPPHVDHHDFIRPFCTLSLLSEQSIMFAQKLVPAGPGRFEARDGCSPALIPLPTGSCLVLKGFGGDQAMHCVPPVQGRRISITLRRMGPEHGEAVSREVAAYEQLRGPLRGFWEEEEAAEAPRRAAAITVK